MCGGCCRCEAEAESGSPGLGRDRQTVQRGVQHGAVVLLALRGAVVRGDQGLVQEEAAETDQLARRQPRGQRDHRAKERERRPHPHPGWQVRRRPAAHRDRHALREGGIRWVGQYDQGSLKNIFIFLNFIFIFRLKQTNYNVFYVE